MPWPNMRDGQVIPEQSAAQVSLDIEQIAAAGMNTLVLSHPSWYASESIQTLDKAYSLGMYVLCATDPSLYAQLKASYPNLIGWVAPDEPDGQGLTPDVMRADYLIRKQADTSLPIFMNHMWGISTHDYLGARDIISSDPYCFAPGLNMGKIVSYIRETKESCGGVLPCWVVLQAFKIPGSMYVPSPEQMRCQTFLALLLGANGILYYSTATPEAEGWHLFSDPESAATWQSMTPLMQEVQEKWHMFIESDLSNASEPGDACESMGILWKTGYLNGQETLAVINSNPVDVTIQIPVQAENVPATFPAYSVNFYNVTGQ